MEPGHGPVRELRPHATWWAIEFTGRKLVEKVAEAGVIAFAVGWLTWFKNHLDVMTVVGGFVVSMLMLTWASRKRSDAGGVGSMSELADPTPNAETIPDALQSAPRLRVDYKDSGQKGVLVFKSDKPTTVRRVRPLLSRERYETEYDFDIIPSPPLSIDANSQVESKMYGLRRQNSPDIHSLVDILRTGTQQSLDSVVIDYDDDLGNEYARRFDLKRNSDDSVAWTSNASVDLRGKTQMPEPAWQDLAELRHKMALAAAYHNEHGAAQQYAKELEANTERFRVLRTAFHDLTAVGQLQLLAEEADSLEFQFNQIIMENSVDGQPIDLSHPLSSEVIAIDLGSSSSIPWQRRRMIAFRDRYEVHRYRVADRSAFQCRVMPPNTPSTLTREQWSIILSDHRKALIEKAQELAKPHLVALSGNSNQ
jgi:hypothetical protein